MFKHFQELINYLLAIFSYYPVIIFLAIFSVLCDERIDYPCCQFALTQDTLPFSTSMNVLFMRTQTSNVNLQMNKISTK